MHWHVKSSFSDWTVQLVETDERYISFSVNQWGKVRAIAYCGPWEINFAAIREVALDLRRAPGALPRLGHRSSSLRRIRCEEIAARLNELRICLPAAEPVSP